MAKRPPLPRKPISAKVRDERRLKRLLALKKGPKTQVQKRNLKRTQNLKNRRMKDSKVQRLISNDFKNRKFITAKQFDRFKYKKKVTKYGKMNIDQLNSQLRKRGLIKKR